MSTGTAIVLSTALVCVTLVVLACLGAGSVRHFIREVLDEVKVSGRDVRVDVDKKVVIDVKSQVHPGKEGAP